MIFRTGGPINCSFDNLEALVYGGAILGGGGGGFLEEGLELVAHALEAGRPEIIHLTDIEPDHYIMTVATVGAPAARHRFVKPMDFVSSFRHAANAFPHSIKGMITNEMGGRASANGLFQSAVLGLPVVDAPANGRAHPLGLMGGLGLHKKSGHISIQAACGGDPNSGRYMEIWLTGDVNRCAAVIREVSVQAGGVVAVARNPIEASWLTDHAAVGAMELTIALGHAYLKALRSKGFDPLEEISSYLEGEVVTKGRATSVEINTKGGLDIGRVLLETGHELTVYNEYITLELNGERLYTFPDLITTLDTSNNLPVNTAEVMKGMDLAVIAARKERLILGSSMRDVDLLKLLEERINTPILKHIPIDVPYN